MSKATDERELLVKTKSEGELRIRIPATWKVTFGPLSMKGYSEGNALRIYESDKQQRACFVDVVSFRDLSIPVLRKLTRKERIAKEQRDGKGNSSYEERVEVNEGEWEDA